MAYLALALGGLLGLAGGILLGLRWGSRLAGGSTGKYWRANAVLFFSGMLLAFAGDVLGSAFLWGVGVGVMGGGVTGLKYGFGRSVGIWRTADRLMRSDDLPE